MAFKKIQLKETEKSLRRFADKVIARAKWNLANRKGKHKGPANTRDKKLSDSLGYNMSIDEMTGDVQIEFGAAEHWKYVEYGRKKNRKAPPPSALRNWIKIKPLRLRDLQTGRYIEKNESNINSAAFLMGRKIKKKGIPPRFFWRDAFAMHYKRLPPHVAKSYVVDVKNFMKRTKMLGSTQDAMKNVKIK